MTIKLSIGKRIAEARSALGLSQIELSEMTGFGKTRISNWETGFRTPKLGDSKILEKTLKIPAPYLLCLTEDKTFSDTSNKKQREFNSIPLFSESEILQAEYPLNIEAHDAVEYLPLIQSNAILAEQGAFAFRLVDNSMSPAFDKNDIIVLNPSVQVRHNDYVLVHIPATNTLVFRKYFLDNAHITKPSIRLIPSNSDWVTNSTDTPSDLRILGVLSTIQRLFT